MELVSKATCAMSLPRKDHMPCLDFCFLDNPIVVFAQCSLRVSEYKAICTAKLTVTFRYLLQAIVLEI